MTEREPTEHEIVARVALQRKRTRVMADLANVDAGIREMTDLDELEDVRRRLMELLATTAERQMRF